MLRREYEHGYAENEEECLPQEGCDAYPCFEKKANCGPKSYLIAYGEKYCHRFLSDGMRCVNGSG